MMPKLGVSWARVAEEQPGPHLGDREGRRQGQRPVRAVGHALGGARRRGQQAEDQQRADRLRGLGRAGADQGQEDEAQQSYGHARAAATASSTEANSSGRAIVRIAAQIPAATRAAVSAWAPDRPKMERTGR